jgi:hypothetical protein
MLQVSIEKLTPVVFESSAALRLHRALVCARWSSKAGDGSPRRACPTGYPARAVYGLHSHAVATNDFHAMARSGDAADLTGDNPLVHHVVYLPSRA